MLRNDTPRAIRALPAGLPPGRYPAGRVCSGDGCDTLLSVYNAGRLCAACEAKHKGEVMHNGKREAALAFLRERPGEVVTSATVGSAIGASATTAGAVLRELMAAGEPIESLPRLGYRFGIITPRKSGEAEEATRAGETPADPASAPAGARATIVAVDEVPLAFERHFSTRPDPEIHALGSVCDALEPLEDGSRERVIRYLVDRYIDRD